MRFGQPIPADPSRAADGPTVPHQQSSEPASVWPPCRLAAHQIKKHSLEYLQVLIRTLKNSTLKTLQDKYFVETLSRFNAVFSFLSGKVKLDGFLSRHRVQKPLWKSTVQFAKVCSPDIDEALGYMLTSITYGTFRQIIPGQEKAKICMCIFQW